MTKHLLHWIRPIWNATQSIFILINEALHNIRTFESNLINMNKNKQITFTVICDKEGDDYTDDADDNVGNSNDDDYDDNDDDDDSDDDGDDDETLLLLINILHTCGIVAVVCACWLHVEIIAFVTT